MGCFSYSCNGCKGRRCNQAGGQSNSCISIIEVPLSDGTTVYLKGEYNESGSVDIDFEDETYEFYPIQFKHLFEGWFENEDEEYRKFKLLAHKVYTYSEEVYVDEDDYDSEDDDDSEDDEDDDDSEEKGLTVIRNCQPSNIKIETLTKEILAKCIRADKYIGLPDRQTILKQKIECTKSIIQRYEKELKEYEEELKKYEPPPVKRKLKLENP